MGCCLCAPSQKRQERAEAMPPSPSPIVRTARQYVGGASGFDSPYNAPVGVGEVPLFALPTRRITQTVQPRFPVWIILLALGIAYLWFDTRKGR